MIPALCREIRTDFRPALHAKRDIIAQGIAQDFRNQRGGARQRFRWFHTNPVASGDGINRW